MLERGPNGVKVYPVHLPGQT